MLISNNCTSFLLWWKENLVKHQRVSKHYGNDCLQNFLLHYTGWPTKMSLFFFGNTFSKNNESFQIFSPQLLEVCRIILVEATLESTMFYYTFSIINTMLIPCTALLYDSTAATRTLKLSTILLSISCGIRLIYLQKRSQMDSTRNAL